MLWHGCRTLTKTRFAMTAQIRHDQAIARRQKVRHRKPKLMVNRKWVEQNYRRAASGDIIKDFGVIAEDSLHRGIIGHASGTFPEMDGQVRPNTPCWATIGRYFELNLTCR